MIFGNNCKQLIIYTYMYDILLKSKATVSEVRVFICFGIGLDDFPILCKAILLAFVQTYDCASASEAAP